MKHLRLFEEHINEIGDASAKPFKVQGPSPREILKDMLHAQENRTDNPIDWLDPDRVVKWSFSGDKGTDYEMEITWTVKKDIQIRLKPGKRKLAKKFAMRMNIGFYAKTKPLTGTEFNIDDEDDRERTTNLHEQYRVLATVIDKSIEVINEVTKEFKIDTIYIIPKADEGEEESINNRRGRFYLAYIKKAIKRLNDKVTASEDKYNGGFIIQGGHRYSTADRLEIRNESAVNEIGDRSVEPGDWIQSKYEKDHKGYSFMTKDEERYYAYFEKKPKVWLNNQGMMKVEEIKNGAKVWETSFGHLKGHIHGYGGEVDFKSATNKGSHFEILSTYSEILEDFLKNNKGKADIIIAKPEKGSEGDNRRLRLYQAFLQKTKIFKKVETIKVFGREVILLYV
jgi:predicted HicB family RNase H-like nuclease